MIPNDFLLSNTWARTAVFITLHSLRCVLTHVCQGCDPAAGACSDMEPSALAPTQHWMAWCVCVCVCVCGIVDGCVDVWNEAECMCSS